MTNLTEVEVKDLIGRYTSELKKLAYQAGKVKEAIADLERIRRSEGDVNVSAGIFDVAGNMATSASFTAAEAVDPPRPKSVIEVLGSNEEVDLPETGSGYRLSEWDYFILDGLRDSGMTLVNSDFFKLAAKKIKHDGLEMSRSQLHGKINRSIHKLTHKRGILVKVPFSGKGYAYALSNWFDGEGKLKSQFKRKSVHNR